MNCWVPPPPKPHSVVSLGFIYSVTRPPHSLTEQKECRLWNKKGFDAGSAPTACVISGKSVHPSEPPVAQGCRALPAWLPFQEVKAQQQHGALDALRGTSSPCLCAVVSRQTEHVFSGWSWMSQCLTAVSPLPSLLWAWWVVCCTKGSSTRLSPETGLLGFC